jgi:hypothetical protein
MFLIHSTLYVASTRRDMPDIIQRLIFEVEIYTQSCMTSPHLRSNVALSLRMSCTQYSCLRFLFLRVLSWRLHQSQFAILHAIHTLLACTARLSQVRRPKITTIFAVNRTVETPSRNLHRCGIRRGKTHRIRNAEIRSSGNGPLVSRLVSLLMCRKTPKHRDWWQCLILWMLSSDLRINFASNPEAYLSLHATKWLATRLRFCWHPAGDYEVLTKNSRRWLFSFNFSLMILHRNRTGSSMKGDTLVATW